ncbi:MAG: hypothetical protein J7647_13235 [Cyanobacteria bacterium SBLK]|nr:hypothetical protein [Cyanobacteria bacterium SBLK]
MKNFNSTPILIQEDYKGFNIIEVNRRFYAVPQGEGAFSLKRVQKEDYSHLLIGGSTNEVKVKIDNQNINLNIKLVKEGYKGFNIIEVDRRFYAVPQGEGAFSLKRVQKEDYSHLLIGGSTNEVKVKIDNHSINLNIKLVKEGYKGFNIIKVDRRFYAIPQEEGSFTLERIEKKDYSLFFLENSIEKIITTIDNQ